MSEFRVRLRSLGQMGTIIRLIETPDFGILPMVLWDGPLGGPEPHGWEELELAAAPTESEAEPHDCTPPRIGPRQSTHSRGERWECPECGVDWVAHGRLNAWSYYDHTWQRFTPTEDSP